MKCCVQFYGVILMMNEERYAYGYEVPLNVPTQSVPVITDTLNGKHYYLLRQIVELLNEQQSIIRKDEISIKTMMSNMEKLEKENERLNNDFHFLKEIHQEGSKNCEKWKQYKEAQIQQLEEENEQLQKDKEILKERLRECRIKMDKFNCR